MNKNYLPHLKEINKDNKEKGLERLENAYYEWLKTKSHIVKAAEKYKTDPTRLKKYIILKGHNLCNCDQTVFDTIDNEEKAYWLGFLYADGSVGLRRAEIELALQLSDLNHLEKFATFLKTKNKPKSDNYRCRLSLGNKKIYQDLINHGCIPQKSKKIYLPELNADIMRHFIRGYFDGDGSITRSRSNTLWCSAQLASGSEKFLQDLLQYLNSNNIVNSEQKIYKSHKSSCFLLSFTNKNFINFMNYLYEDCNIALERKLQRYQNSIAVFLSD